MVVTGLFTLPYLALSIYTLLPLLIIFIGALHYGSQARIAANYLGRGNKGSVWMILPIWRNSELTSGNPRLCNYERLNYLKSLWTCRREEDVSVVRSRSQSSEWRISINANFIPMLLVKCFKNNHCQMELRILWNSQDFPRRFPGASKTTIAKWSSEYYGIPKIFLEDSQVLQQQP